MSIMATSIAKLVERGDIAWDSTILEMLPELAGRILAEYEEVTVRDLLSHRAGLMPFTSGAGQVEIDINRSLTGSPREKRAQFVEKVLNQPPVHEPGTTFEFSNAGYAIVAAFMEKRLEKPLDDALRELVFDPLAMTSAAVSMPATVADPDDTWGHHPIRDQLIAVGPGPAAVLPEILEPGNGVSCSIEDFAKFAQAHLRALRGGDVDGFEGDALRELHEPVIDATCMGWFTQEVLDEICHFNRGSSGLFYCWILIWPEQDLAIVTTSNAGNGEEACRRLAEALFRKFGE
jgi:CubicO group peptidase (beta-lactamase class C family)